MDGQSERIVGAPIMVGPARHPLPLVTLEEPEVSEPRREPPFGAAFFLSILAKLFKDAITMASSFERERVARWLRKGEVLDPRNDDDYDTWDAGMEPIPGDKKWVNKKAPEGLEKH